MRSLMALLSKLGICAHTGALDGVITGFMCAAVEIVRAPGVLPWRIAFALALFLGLVGWSAALLFIGLVGRYGVWRMMVPALMTCLIVSLLTVLIAFTLGLALLDPLIGWLIGLTVGEVFCVLSRRAPGAANHVG
jgi:hypothetical protein